MRRVNEWLYGGKSSVTGLALARRRKWDDEQKGGRRKKTRKSKCLIHINGIGSRAYRDIVDDWGRQLMVHTI